MELPLSDIQTLDKEKNLQSEGTLTLRENPQQGNDS